MVPLGNPIHSLISFTKYVFGDNMIAFVSQYKDSSIFDQIVNLIWRLDVFFNCDDDKLHVDIGLWSI